mmetsp:Transcript_41345/g.74797  ORF Transcript_41345/g.74797 Transcript_41345/m.74797 type:complete len:253 (+) Transcript_41345:70-828(+)
MCTDAPVPRARDLQQARRILHRPATSADSMMFNVMGLEGTALSGTGAAPARCSQKSQKHLGAAAVPAGKQPSPPASAVPMPKMSSRNKSPNSCGFLNALALETATPTQSHMPRSRSSFGPTSTDRSYLEIVQAKALSGFARKGKSKKTVEVIESVATSAPPSPPSWEILSEADSLTWKEVGSPGIDHEDAKRAALLHQMATVAARLAALPVQEAQYHEAASSQGQQSQGWMRQCSAEVEQHQAYMHRDRLVF